MIERTKQLADERMGDILRVILPNGGVLAMVHLVDLATLGQLLLITVSIGYTLWRWRRDARKDR